MSTVVAPDLSATAAPPRPKYVRVVGGRLKVLLAVIFALFALLGANSLYLGAITFLGWANQASYENYFYQWMFIAHLIGGLALVLPVVIFGVFHIKNAWNRPNPRAKAAGYALFIAAIVLFLTGVLLTRVDYRGFKIDVKNPATRSLIYWGHVLAPLAACWFFVLHRLAGRKIKWYVGGVWLVVAGGFAAVMLVLQSQDPRRWDQVGPKSGEKYFFPSLSRTATGNFIPERALLNDQFCKECHADVHATWSKSVHKFSSFNNPPYEFSVLETRRKMFARDGNVQGARFCAGCHDPVPFFTGAFDDPKFDDPAYDLSADRLAQAGITCSVCHSINTINSVRGNADYTIDEPAPYPFQYSDHPFLKWVNRQLIKAKPALHKKTFLKPHHQTAEFCGSCHKVHLPEELNGYKWLRGQNHYDPFLLSGVSGHGIQSFYYPERAEQNCNRCHLPLLASNDFGARNFDGSGVLKVHDHQFPSANTAIPHLLNLGEDAIQKHRDFLDGVMRVDIFALKQGGTIAGALTAPLRPHAPELEPGRTYLLDAVIRTVKMGHIFTQGTADSNEVWMDVTLRSGDRVIGRSGGMNPADREVDPFSHFVNAYVIDREGNRIDRRNAEDIFLPLYSNQIPPGAADVVHYKFRVPEDVNAPITIDVKLQYRKFDTTYMKHFQREAFVTNDLPITTLATDRLTLPVKGVAASVENPPSTIPEWQRWNDYGIAALRKAEAGELRQADDAFAEVTRLGRPDGAMNRARVAIREGRMEDAAIHLSAAAAAVPPPYPWSHTYWSAVVDKENREFVAAIAKFEAVVNMRNELTQTRRFDFSKDYTLLAELAQTYYQQSRVDQAAGDADAQRKGLIAARLTFERVLELDPENATAHYNLAQILEDFYHLQSVEALREEAAAHRALFEKYQIDDNARGEAIRLARQKSEAANIAADATVIYDLQRPGAYEGPSDLSPEFARP